ncbi:MAG: HTH-type transcriptional repressor PurR [Phycisphaerae bacterium]|nr:HTH-type transcriptional repressor PurR [Phycisphaerae bacterium]
MKTNRSERLNDAAEQFAILLRRRFGDYIPGSRIPGRDELGRYFHVSERVVRRALEMLTKEGVLNNRGRSGLVVMPRPASRLRRIVVFDQPRKIALFRQSLLLGASYRCERLGIRMDVRRDWPDFAEPSTLAEVCAPLQPGEAGLFFLEELPPPAILQAWQAQRVPFVAVDMYPQGIKINLVARDTQNAAYKATEALILLGHRRICYLGIEPPEGATTVVTERLRGFRMAMERHAVPMTDSTFMQTAFDRTKTRAAITRVLRAAEGDRPTAFVTMDQGLGCEVLLACDALGVNVPEQVSVISIGADRPDLPEVSHRLTCYSEGTPERLGELAVDVLVHSFRRPEPAVILTGHNFVDRGSIAAPAMSK